MELEQITQIKLKRFENLVYTLTSPDGPRHDCVFVIGKNHAVTYETDDHSNLEENRIYTMYNLLDKNLKVEVTIFLKKTLLGFIIFETLNGHNFEFFPETSWHTTVQRPYHQLGINQTNRTPLWITGTLVEKEKYCRTFTGSTDGTNGDVIFDKYARLIGIVIRKTDEKIKILKADIFKMDLPFSSEEEVDEVELT